MKLHFEPNLDYQLAAIEAVCDLFRGQETCRTEFTVTKSALGGAFIPGLESDLGVGNRLTLLDDELHKNLGDIQLRHGLAPSSELTSGDFTVEMETGTGKTYVYLRTIFELNKRSASTSFGGPFGGDQRGCLQITSDYGADFKGLYAGVLTITFSTTPISPARFAPCNQRQYSTMVVIVGAINKGRQQLSRTAKRQVRKPID